MRRPLGLIDGAPCQETLASASITLFSISIQQRIRDIPYQRCRHYRASLRAGMRHAADFLFGAAFSFQFFFFEVA